MINFINPKSPFLEKDGMMPPLGLFYLVSALKREGIKARVVDLGLGDLLPDGKLFVTGTTAQKKEILKLKGVNSVLGGPHASVDAEAMARKFGLVIVGEGEEIIKHVVKDSPTGIIKASRIKHLDRLAFPDRTQAHRYHWEINGKKATTVMTSRGCNGKCSFCCKAIVNHGIYFRSPDNVIAELKEIKQFGFGAVMFYDDSIAMIPKRLKELCSKMESLDLVWRAFVRSDQVTQDIMNRMAQSGCYEVLIGVESGSNQILKNIRKNETVNHHKFAIECAKIAGIKVKALMIVGLPGETWDTIAESDKFIQETRPDSLDITILSVYRGCDIFENPKKYDISFDDPLWYKGRNDEYQSSVSTSGMSKEEIELAREMLWATFKSL